MSKRKSILLIFIILIQIHIYSQNWEPIGDTNQQNVRFLYSDSVDGMLYIGGSFRYINDSIDAKGIVKWDGETFYSLGNFPNSQCNNYNCDPVHSIIRFKDEIYCTLINASPNEGEIRGIAKWNGTYWDSLGAGIQGGVFNQIIYNEELYVMGRFGVAGQDTVKSISKWDGENWFSCGFPYSNNGVFNITIKAATVFNGNLYVGGNFWSSDETVKDVAFYDGTNWNPVGNGIQGFADDVTDLIVFNDEIYVCGDFKVSSGNDGNKIMKLKNDTWVNVGGSFDSELAQVSQMKIIHDKLYVFGLFESVGGGIPATNIAIWDGEKWCGTGTIMDGKITSAAVYQESLIIAGGFDEIDGIEISELAKWVGGEQIDTCGAIVSAIEPEITEKSFELFPNPASHKLRISITGDFQNQPITLSVFNILGERLFEQRGFDPGKAVDVSGLASGTYILQLQSGEEALARKFVVQR